MWRAHWIWLGPLTVSCSLLVGGAPEPMACSEESRSGPPACDPGFTCRGQVCVADVAGSGASSGAAGALSGDAGASAGESGAAAEGPSTGGRAARP
jgi:hypothetical protein